MPFDSDQHVHRERHLNDFNGRRLPTLRRRTASGVVMSTREECIEVVIECLRKFDRSALPRPALAARLAHEL
ncbi:MAG: hypothetical protein M3P29_10090, partial [Acidobacteriota bacterium]|nr:hypothetical protein [Acidobacteriota bacterium]